MSSSETSGGNAEPVEIEKKEEEKVPEEVNGCELDSLKDEADVKEATDPLESTEEPEKAEISTELLNTPDSTEALNNSDPNEAPTTPDPTEVLTTPDPIEAPNTPELTEALTSPVPTEGLNTPELPEMEGEVEKDGEVEVSVGLSAQVEEKEKQVDGNEEKVKEKEDVKEEKSVSSCVTPTATVSAASKVTKKLPCSSVTVTISVSKKESEVVHELKKKEDEESSKDEIIVLGSKKMKPLNDEEWFLKLSDDELTWYRENGPHSSYFEHKTIQCTGCSSQILNTGQDQVFRHPSLGVAICKGCKNYYQNGEWTKDDDGYDVYCRWCGNGGDLLLCDFCTHSFCKRCIQRNLGRKKLHEICEADTWQCLLCQPSLIYYQRSIYHAFVQFQCEKSLKARKSLKKKESNIARETFLDENIAEAFKTLSIYQKCLEDERRRWLKCKKRMDSDSAGAIAKNLRKIYAITKQNMDLLDADLVQSYSESFPSSSINNIDVGGGVDPVVNQKKRKRIAPPSPVASHADEFIVNGSPVTADYYGADIDEEFDPSSLLQVEFRETIVPSFSLKGSSTKLSKSIRNNDSDIEVLTLDSDDEPSSPQPKKRRPGPKSKTMYLD